MMNRKQKNAVSKRVKKMKEHDELMEKLREDVGGDSAGRWLKVAESEREAWDRKVEEARELAKMGISDAPEDIPWYKAIGMIFGGPFILGLIFGIPALIISLLLWGC